MTTKRAARGKDTNLMRCAKGIFAKGILGCTGFSLLRWEKGSETPYCGGEKGLRLSRSLGRSMRNEGVSDPFSPSQQGVSDPFSHRKRGNLAHPQIPLAKIPLAQRIIILWTSRFRLIAHRFSARSCADLSAL